VLPAAALAGLLASILVNAGNRITMWMQGYDPDSFVPRLFIDAISSAVMGAGTVWAGARTAPSHKTVVVFVLAAVSIAVAGMMSFPAIITRSGWAIYAIIWWIVGASAVAWSVYSGEMTEADL